MLVTSTPAWYCLRLCSASDIPVIARWPLPVWFCLCLNKYYCTWIHTPLTSLYSAWGERWGEDSNAGEWVFNKKIKQRATKTTRRGKTDRQAENCLHSQHNTHTSKDNGSAQDYRHSSHTHTYIYIYIYAYSICVCIYIYIHIYMHTNIQYIYEVYIKKNNTVNKYIHTVCVYMYIYI